MTAVNAAVNVEVDIVAAAAPDADDDDGEVFTHGEYIDFFEERMHENISVVGTQRLMNFNGFLCGDFGINKGSGMGLDIQCQIVKM